MDWVEYVFKALAGVLAIYVAARLITAAYFKSRQQYDKERKQEP